MRIVGQNVIVATMMPRDASAPGWEHAAVYAIDARTGVEVARRVLPDPVPVAAMVIEAGVLHVVATRRGEPIFWYALSPADLVPRHRRTLSLAAGHDDVLEAWAAPEGGLWLELEAATGTDAQQHALAYAFADGGGTTPAVWRPEETPRGACRRTRRVRGGTRALRAGGRAVGGRSHRPPALSRLSPGADEDAGWVRATVVGTARADSRDGRGPRRCAPSPWRRTPSAPIARASRRSPSTASRAT